MDYFIDESEDTGNLANGNLPSNFGDQPIFCLAAIVIATERLLKIEIDRLKAIHRVQLSELKASMLYDRMIGRNSYLRFRDFFAIPGRDSSL